MKNTITKTDEYVVKVLSDVTPINFLRGIEGNTKALIKFEFNGLDQFITEVNKVDHYDFILIHLSGFAFNSYNLDDKYLIQLKKIFSSLKNILKNTNCILILNSIYFDISAFSQLEIIKKNKLVADCNHQIYDFVEEYSDRTIFVDVSAEVSRIGGDKHLSMRNYSVMRAPYTKELSEKISNAYKLQFDSFFESKIKVVFVDADNTLWGGILGEDGIEGLQIGNEYPGSIYYEFQCALLNLKKVGILLCLITKNNELDIKELFNKRSMPLSISDFVEIRAGWDRKSSSITDILKSLNLGSSSAIFIDDSLFELDEVKNVHPDLNCVKFEPIKSSWHRIFSNNTYINRRIVTSEDLIKTEIYRTEEARKKFHKSSNSIDEYLEGLEISLRISKNDPLTIPRISQLTMKTNQFNLTTTRYTELEISNFMLNGNVYAFGASDKFGDMGVVGLVIVIDQHINTFLLSCRAFGRGIEDAMLEVIVNDVQHYPITAEYITSLKNQMCINFYTLNDFMIIYSDDKLIKFKISNVPTIRKHHIKDIKWLIKS
jgi:FkbH-like protein